MIYKSSCVIDLRTRFNISAKPFRMRYSFLFQFAIMKKNLLLILALYAIYFVTTSVVFAQKWAEDMFEERRHSFGSVAIGVEAIHRFKFTNPYPEDIHIVSVTSSCGCTTPSWPKNAIKYNETGEIIAKLNTDGQHKNDKSATLTVDILAKNGDKPYRAQVQLQVTSYIRPDVVIKPGVVDFGSIREGKGVVKKLTLQYAGKPNWELVDIERENPHIQVDAEEVGRQNGRVLYSITVTILNTMPSGYVHDMVRFITNDPNPNGSVVTLPVHGYVTPPLVAKPSPFVIGFVQPGETIKKNLVLRSDAKFRITKITSNDPRFQFSFSNSENNTTHVLPITFTADAELGDLTEPILIQTTLAGQQQMHLITQGMVYDDHLLAERVKQQQRIGAPQTTGNERKQTTELAENSSRMQIRMPQNESPSPSPPSQEAHDDVPDPGRNRQDSIASRPSGRNGISTPPIIDLTDDAKDAVADPEETLVAGMLKSVPQLDPNELTMEPDLESGQGETTAPPTVAMRQTTVPVPVNSPKPTVSPSPPPNVAKVPAKKAEPSSDWEEVPFVSASSEPAVERANNRPSSGMSPVPKINSVGTLDQSASDFVVVDDAVTAPAPVRGNTQPEVRRAITAEPEPLIQERSPAALPQSQGLSFSKPSVQSNLAAFTESKPQPAEISGVFDVVGDPKNSSSEDNELPASQETAARVARAVPIAETPKIPPVPGMRPTNAMPTTPTDPPTPMAPVSPNTREPAPQGAEPGEAKPQSSYAIANDLASPPPSRPISPKTPSESSGDFDKDLLSTLLSDTKTADTSPQTIAQSPPQATMRDDTPVEPDGLKLKELQPLEPGDLGPLNGQLVTIASKTGEGSGLDETEFDDDTDVHLPKELMPPFEGNSQKIATNPPRNRLPEPGELPSMGLPPSSPEQRQRTNNSAVIANGAPIPMRQQPQPMGQEQVGQRQVIANNSPAPRATQLPSSNMQQRAIPQQPAQNPMAQQQMPQRALTPQQQRAMQQQQMMQQRQLAVQQGRNATPNQTPNTRVAQSNPQYSQQHAVPPAPVVPNTPMMTGAPSFR